ncbi:SUF system NifU family Fe-S cluster assembly protein [Apilactobacillus micheneri]|uniref:SUF system NifU family Fe-S cluster assembly protein n=1 Tax=Apilactobacillus micheneri TaxID=1899430 RepID=A0ABY2Z0V0_9LACO|nr:SUF system NifU family Fe-S cluster assembly protein [Apilactobacillus micheneri]TPR26444.1 SUF system NifU family Fe-S cluster assembly protein [Apilactobacillus micheneri]TPR27198.1 SUF system NifU family Fe-S cluster assembly protein [Apilactobacillus micheneri]TPR27445.1 SUF system NifU family Fe-S cluster assembly protein [Apilactobacillus micheneri]TPR31961.1 SUF system NifU family Fe-S cluster assembly protein [Apilactobacillus micheneri]TPR32365.1 SUF system NifU family Fe-S cluster
MELRDLYQRIILENAKKCPNEQFQNETVHLHNPTCGDDIAIKCQYDNNLFKDFEIKADGCIIFKAATTFMKELCINKTKEEIEDIVLNFSKFMTNDKKVNQKILGDAVVLQSVSHLPMRIKCAMLPFKAIYQLVNGDDNNQ